jgi:hypothetical protein
MAIVTKVELVTRHVFPYGVAVQHELHNLATPIAVSHLRRYLTPVAKNHFMSSILLLPPVFLLVDIQSIILASMSPPANCRGLLLHGYSLRLLSFPRSSGLLSLKINLNRRASCK